MVDHYAGFVTVVADVPLVERFMAETHSALPPHLLHDLLKVKKHGLKLQFNHHEASGLYLVMVNGQHDYQLIDLAHKYQFPRGCLVLWSPGLWMGARGFFPKFENDRPEQVSFDVSLLEGAEKLSFFVKWSGFLGHFLCFRDDTRRVWWTVASKKSADCSYTFVVLLRDVVG